MSFYSVKLPKSFVAVNLSDAFSWPKQHGEDELDEAGLEMKLRHANEKETAVTAAQGLVSAISDGAMAAEEDVPRL